MIRLFFPSSRDHALPRELVAVDQYLGWRLEKDVSVTHRVAGFSVTYSTNSLGYRDRPRILKKDHRRLRILVYGDSQVFGWGIPAEQRFSNLAAGRIDSVEAWNLAVPGYGLDQQILSYERYGKDFDADAVVFFVSEATLHRMFFDYLFGMNKPTFGIDEDSRLQVKAPRKAPGRSVLYKMPNWIYLPYFLDRQLGIWDDRWRRSRMERKAPEPRHEILERTFETAYWMALARRQRMIILAELPAARRPWLRSLCSGLDVSYMDIDLPENRDSLVLGKEDPHWNAKCHQLIADQLSSPLARLIGTL
ncbi:MAG: SGNH/GDSL hydrolase family protein [bacterium]|nr:SGNH/GDSL hydrolase family protein [bacterium]